MILGELQAKQISALYNDGMTVEQIASSLEVDPALVKLAVSRNSQDGDRDINDDDLKALRQHAVDLAMRAEDQAVQARMTIFLIERDKPRVENKPISPIVLINQALVDMGARYQEAVKSYHKPDDGNP